MTDESIDREAHEQNRRSWNAITPAHNSHKGDQAAFLRGGGSTLRTEELELLGSVESQRAVHLSCNCGQDTLSLAARGARVLGVDISDAAIEVARGLSRDAGLPAEFVRADVYDWLRDNAGCARFDLVYASYGALCWLSDLPAWARGVRGVLAPGGRLVVIEFHPVFDALEFAEDVEDAEALRVRLPYSTGDRPVRWPDGVHDYVAASREGLVPWGYEEGQQDFTNPEPCVEYTHGIGEVLTALLDAGLTLERFREYPYTNGCRMFPAMVDLGEQRYGLPGPAASLPLMYGLVARA